MGPWASRLAYRVFGDVHLLPGRDVRHPWWRPDLVFPHHENEIAQSEAATGKLYANAWMHAGAVRVDGEKMSKSLGNFFTIREVLEKYHPEVVRYLLVSSHYRSPINYSEDSLREAKSALERFYNGLKGLPEAQPAGGDEFVARFAAAMDDDFNSPEACAVLFEMIREVNRLRESDLTAAAALAARLKELAGVLGVLQLEPGAFLQAGAAGKVDAAEVEALIAARLAARAERTGANPIASEISLPRWGGAGGWQRRDNLASSRIVEYKQERRPRAPFLFASFPISRANVLQRTGYFPAGRHGSSGPRRPGPE